MREAKKDPTQVSSFPAAPAQVTVDFVPLDLFWSCLIYFGITSDFLLTMALGHLPRGKHAMSWKVKQHTQLHVVPTAKPGGGPDGGGARTVTHECKQKGQEKGDSKARWGNRRSVRSSPFKVGMNPHMRSCNADTFSLKSTLEKTHGYARCLEKKKAQRKDYM